MRFADDDFIPTPPEALAPYVPCDKSLSNVELDEPAVPPSANKFVANSVEPLISIAAPPVGEIALLLPSPISP